MGIAVAIGVVVLIAVGVGADMLVGVGADTLVADAVGVDRLVAIAVGVTVAAVAVGALGRGEIQILSPPAVAA